MVVINILATIDKPRQIVQVTIMRPLGKMCYEGAELEEVRDAIGRGEDINKSYWNNTGLMWAVMEKRNSIVKLLLEQPTLDLNCIEGRHGRSALHFAAVSDNVEGARMLLADPRLNTHNHKNNVGKTPVHYVLSPYGIWKLRILPKE